MSARKGGTCFWSKDLNAPANTGTAAIPVTGHTCGQRERHRHIVPNPRPNTTISYFTNTRPVANSNYNSLQASLNHRFTHGLQTQVSYTYSEVSGFDIRSGWNGDTERLGYRHAE